MKQVLFGICGTILTLIGAKSLLLTILTWGERTIMPWPAALLLAGLGVLLLRQGGWIGNWFGRIHRGSRGS